MNLQELQDRLWEHPKRVVFTGIADEEMLKALRYLADSGLVKPIVVGSPLQVHALAETHKIRLHGVSVKKPLHDPDFDVYSRFYRKKVEPGLSYAGAREKLQQPLLYAALLVRHGQADVCLATAGETLEDLLLAERIFSGGSPCVSAATLIWDDESGQTLLFADTRIHARPDARTLACIATQSAETFRRLNGTEAQVAFLSFSTKGSAEHPRVQTVREALRLLQEENPLFVVDGELQFDAAFVPEILRKKAGQTPLKGKADVYVFPSLSAADPAVKIVETLSKWQTSGPILQGLKAPLQWLPEPAQKARIIRQVIIASGLLND